MGKRRIELLGESGNSVRLRVRVADSAAERSAGFQRICPQIIDTSAILFVYDSPRPVTFHMFNVHKSLDIAFISESFEVVSIQRMKPQDRDDPDAVRYSPEEPVMFALETPAGFFDRHGLEERATRLVVY